MRGPRRAHRFAPVPGSAHERAGAAAAAPREVGEPGSRRPSEHRRVPARPYPEEARVLGSSDQALCRAYDLAMLDLDGVVYVGGDAIPGAPERLAEARAAGERVGFT